MSKQDVEQDIMLTTLAVREHLMGYFKGAVGMGVVDHSAVNFRHRNNERRSHQYERELAELRNPGVICIGDTYAIDVGKSPNTAIINPVMGRSPEFRAIKDNLIKFFHDYLPNVRTEVGESLGDIEEVSDKELIRSEPEGRRDITSDVWSRGRIVAVDEMTTIPQEILDRHLERLQEASGWLSTDLPF